MILDLWILGRPERIREMFDDWNRLRRARPNDADDVESKRHVVEPSPMQKHPRRAADLSLFRGSNGLPRLAIIGAGSSFHLDENPRRSMPCNEIDFADGFPRGMNDDSIPALLQPFRRQSLAAPTERRRPPVFPTPDEIGKHCNPPIAAFFIEHAPESARSGEWTGRR